jgi:uncharacterized membrane protein HdeD (DUF308 family)
MVAGLVLLFAGILIAIYPLLLSIIVAAVLIGLGLLIVSVAYFNRKLRKYYDNPAIELFLRF